MAPRLESYHRHSLPRAPSVPPPKLYHLSERRKSPHGQTAPRRGRKGNFAKTEQWTRRQYGELLARDGERLVLQPPGATDDRKARLMRAAENMVNRNYAIRLAGINRAAEKLLAGQTLQSKRTDLGR